MSPVRSRWRLAGWQQDSLPTRSYRDTRKPIGSLRNVIIDNIRARVADKFEPLYRGDEHRDLINLEYAYLSQFVKYGPQLSCISITGLPGHNIEGLTLSNIHITYPGRARLRTPRAGMFPI